MDSRGKWIRSFIDLYFSSARFIFIVFIRQLLCVFAQRKNCGEVLLDSIEFNRFYIFFTAISSLRVVQNEIQQNFRRRIWMTLSAYLLFLWYQLKFHDLNLFFVCISFHLKNKVSKKNKEAPDDKEKWIKMNKNVQLILWIEDLLIV